LARSIVIKIKEVPVEAYNSIGIVERYHALLHCLYKIIRDKLKNKNVDKEMILQIAVKAVNNSAGPNRLVPTLLVFGIYLQFTEIDLLSLSVTKRAEAIHAVIKEVRQLHAERQVQDVLAIYNSPDTKIILDLLLQSDIQVWCKKDK
jgi:hypothetical protein